MSEPVFIPFTSIGKLSDTVRNIRHQHQFTGIVDGKATFDRGIPIPPTIFTGTVKLHGTNAAICTSGETIWFQSRKRIITAQSDNHGFAAFYSGSAGVEIKKLMTGMRIGLGISAETPMALFGEWCGEGVQRGVALTQLSKRFVVFALRTLEGVDPKGINIYKYYKYPIIQLPHSCVYDIRQAKTFSVELDCNNLPKASKYIDSLTQEVEDCCPFGNLFDVEGVGEGIVWTAYTPYGVEMFKSKGEKHANVKRRDRKSAPVDAEKLASISDFIKYAVTDNRLEQGYDELFVSKGLDASDKDIGAFIKWVISDVLKEEIDTLNANGLVVKEIGSPIAKVVVPWIKQRNLNYI